MLQGFFSDSVSAFSSSPSEHVVAYLSDPELIVATAFFYGASMVHPKRFFDAPLTAMTVACFTGFFIVFLKKKILLGLIPEFSMAIVPIVFSLATLYNFVLQRKDYNEENPEDDEDNDDDDDDGQE